MDAKKIASGRGRPRGFDVEKALDTAVALFHERGYDGVGIADLSRAIGVGPPSLYAAFGCKGALFERALARYAAREGRFVAEALAGDAPPAAAIEALLVRAADAYTQASAPGCLVMDGTRNCADLRAVEAARTLRAAARGHVRSCLAHARPDEADARADAVMAALAGLSAAARDGMPRGRLREVARMLARGIGG